MLLTLSVRVLADLSGNPQLSDRSLLDGPARFNPQIAWLSVAGCENLTDASIRAVLAQCPRLYELSIEHCPLIALELEDSTEVSERPTEADVLGSSGNAVKECPSLDEDAVAGSVGNNIDGSCSDEYFMETEATGTAAAHKLISKSLGHLRGKNSGVSVISLLSLARHCPALERIDLRECRRASMSSMSTLPRIAFWKFFLHPQLSLTSLTELHLSRAAALDEAIVCAIIRKYAGSLLCLSLTQFPSFSVNDAVVSTIAACCVSLQRLNLSDCSGVTDVGISALTGIGAVANAADGGNARKLSLSELNINGCETVTASSALGLVLASGRAQTCWSHMLEHCDDDDDGDGDDEEFVEADNGSSVGIPRAELMDALEACIASPAHASNVEPRRLPFLADVHVKLAGVGSRGKQLLRHAGLLQEFEMFSHHWTEMFF